MSMIWSRLHQLDGSPDLADAARRANSYLKRNQVISGLLDQVDGAIPGSAPIWGRYMRFTFPNWAAKFFADALLMAITNTPVPRTPGISQPAEDHGVSHV